MDTAAGPDHEQALRRAEELAARALSATEARCGVLALFISECERGRARGAAWSSAVRDLRALQDRRAGLARRLGLIREALATEVGDPPAPAAVPVPPPPAALRVQHQVQLQPRRRRQPP